MKIDYRAVFVGKTTDDEDIIIYEHVDHQGEFSIQRGPEGPLLPLPKDSEVTTLIDPERQLMRLKIVSPFWSGEATGTKWELLEVRSR